MPCPVPSGVPYPVVYRAQVCQCALLAEELERGGEVSRETSLSPPERNPVPSLNLSRMSKKPATERTFVQGVSESLNLSEVSLKPPLKVRSRSFTRSSPVSLLGVKGPLLAYGPQHLSTFSQETHPERHHPAHHSLLLSHSERPLCASYSTLFSERRE